MTHAPGDRGEGRRVRLGEGEVGHDVAGAGCHGRGRLRPRSQAPAARDRFPEVLGVGQPVEAGPELVLPVPVELLDELAVPVEFHGQHRTVECRTETLLIWARLGAWPPPPNASFGYCRRCRPVVRGPDRQLAEHLGVTVRTVRRDVERLRELGYAIDADLGVTGGYRLGRAGRCLPPLTLDDEEAVVLAACLRAAAGGSMAAGSGTIETILDRLEHMLPARAGDQVGAVLATTTRLSGATDSAEQVRPAVLSVLTRACREREILLVTYRDARDRRSERRLEPLRIVSAGRRWYLVARDIDRDAWRTLRVDRVVRRSHDRPPVRAVGSSGPGPVGPRAITVAPYRYQAVVELDAPLHRVAALVPPTVGGARIARRRASPSCPPVPTTSTCWRSTWRGWASPSASAGPPCSAGGAVSWPSDSPPRLGRPPVRDRGAVCRSVPLPCPLPFRGWCNWQHSRFWSCF